MTIVFVGQLGINQGGELSIDNTKTHENWNFYK
jgi:hypothetical protein